MNTTNTKEPIEQNEKRKGILFLENLEMRDYFASKAMQALLSEDRYTGIIGVNNYEHRRAEDAYKVADAMLKVRQE